MEDHHSSTNFELWTKDEDHTIITFIHDAKMAGKKIIWKSLDEKIPQHSSSNIRDRWENVLDPVIKTTEWSTQEKWLLYLLKSRQNINWNNLVKFLNGRTETVIKEYWQSNIINYTQDMERPLEKHFELIKTEKI